MRIRQFGVKILVNFGFSLREAVGDFFDVRLGKIAVFSAFTLALVGAPAAASVLGLSKIASYRPSDPATQVIAPPGDPDRLFILSLRTGSIDLLNRNTGAISPTPYLSSIGIGFSSTTVRGSAISMAFAPDFATSGKFYVSAGLNRTATTPKRQVIYEYTASSASATTVDTATRRTILSLDYPAGGGPAASGHIGGAITFGNDGYLYVSTGDGQQPFGAGANNPAQDATNKYGGILRIDPTGDAFPADANNNYAIPPGNPNFGPGSDPALVALGARNPFRMTSDPVSGHIFFADVGEDSREEINLFELGANYGWDAFEGSVELYPNTLTQTPPIYEYGHGAGDFDGLSVTGGLVYRGGIPDIEGHYFFGDFVSPNNGAAVWSFTFDDALSLSETIRWDLTYDDPADQLNQILGFGSDGSDNLYVLDFDGDVFAVTDANVTTCLLKLLPVLYGTEWRKPCQSQRSRQHRPGVMLPASLPSSG